MSPARFLAGRDYASLRSAFRHIVRIVGGARGAERITRVSHQAIDRYGSTNPEHEDRFAPIDIIADLEAECGSPIVTRKLAELSGYVLVPLPAAPGSTCKIDLLTAKAVARFGETLTGIAVAKADGVITTEEARTLEPQIDELVTKLVRLKHEINARAAEGEIER